MPRRDSNSSSVGSSELPTTTKYFAHGCDGDPPDGQPMTIVIVLGFGDREEHHIICRNGLQRREANVQVAVASAFREQPASTVVDGQHLLPRRELGSGAPRRVLDILPFSEIVCERGGSDLDDRTQVVVDSAIERAGQKHVDQPAYDDEGCGEGTDEEQRQPAADALNPQHVRRRSGERIACATAGMYQFDQMPVIDLAT